GLSVARLALPNESGFVGHWGVKMLIQAIEAEVKLAAHEPFRIRQLPLQHFFERFEPDQFLLRLSRPKFVRRANRFVIELLILRYRFDLRLTSEFFWRMKNPLLVEHGGDIN